MSSKYNIENASSYSLRKFEPTDYLAFRDIPSFIKCYSKNNLALDYGCGTGRSTRFLIDNGYKTIGVDINLNMLRKAKEVDSDGNYLNIKSSISPFPNETFDLVFSSFVLLEIPSKNDLLDLFFEFNRILKLNGKVITIVNTKDFYKRNWVSNETIFPENNGELVSGQKVKVRLLPQDLLLYDYYWTDKDYKEVFNSTGFKLSHELKPLGKQSDNINWKDEIKSPPHVIYIKRKI